MTETEQSPAESNTRFYQLVDPTRTSGVSMLPPKNSGTIVERVITSYSIHYTKLYDTCDGSMPAAAIASSAAWGSPMDSAA